MFKTMCGIYIRERNNSTKERRKKEEKEKKKGKIKRRRKKEREKKERVSSPKCELLHCTYAFGCLLKVISGRTELPSC